MKIVKRGLGYGGSNISKENVPKVTAADVISRYNAEISRTFSTCRKA